ncbi:MAG: helix-turn-helix domain-containing protein [Treponema sp.]|nr:helix-turn-helix domain-containing protein [Treponema sp.]
MQRAFKVRLYPTKAQR